MASYFSSQYGRVAGATQVRRYFSISDTGKIAYVEFRSQKSNPQKRMASIGSLAVLNVTDNQLTMIPKMEFDAKLQQALTLIFEGICNV